MDNKLLDTLIGLLLIVCGAYLSVTFVMPQEEVPPHQHLDVVEQDRQCQLINKILEHAMEGMGADRAYLFQFHNGVHAGDRQFLYYSNTHEVCAPGVSPEIMGLQRLPLSILAPTWMPKMAKSKAWYLETAKEKHEQTKKILEDQGILALMISRVQYTGEIIGFVGVDYVREIPSKPDEKQLIEAANLIQAVIGGKRG